GRSGPLSRRSTLVTVGVTRGHDSTSTVRAQTRSIGASMSMVFSNFMPRTVPSGTQPTMRTVDARSVLLDRVVADVAEHGLTNRSLRDIAAAVGTSHRMLLYHFGSREGLVSAIVDAVEAAQRTLLRDLAAETSDPADLVLAL